METPTAPAIPGGLPAPKHELILAAAMAEFAALGYERASMAEIARAAGCSKALLFHYFATKANLFLHAYGTGLARLYDALSDSVPRAGDDLFAAVERSAAAKARLAHEQPHLTEFMVAAWYETASEVADSARHVNAGLLAEQDRRLLALAERTRLRPEVTPRVAVDLLQWTTDGFARHALATEQLQGELETQLRAYLEPLRRGLTADRED